VLDEIAFAAPVAMPDAEERARRWARSLGVEAHSSIDSFHLSTGKQKVCLPPFGRSSPLLSTS
jgi:hypothetical protein